MWPSFALALIAGALFLYLPGYLLLRALRISAVASFALAPVLCMAFYAVICIAYGKLGVACSWESVALPVMSAAVVLAVVSAFVEWRKAGQFRLASDGRTLLGWPSARIDAALLAGYCLVGMLLVTFFFVRGLDGSGSFMQEIDNAHHLNAVRSFLDSGIWSSLSSSLYLADASGVDPVPGTVFYPSAWHDMVCLVADATGVDVTQAVNAVNTLLAGMVFPSCSFLLLRRIFDDDVCALACGAVVSLAFAAFPWKMLYWGPLYPNLASMCVLPTVAFLFMELTSARRSLPTRASAGVLFVAGAVVLALLQPNAVFSAAVFLAPWCVHRVVEATGGSPRFACGRRAWQAVFGCAFVLFVVAVWAVLYNLPSFKDVVSHDWIAVTGWSQALVNILTLSYRNTMVQIVLGILVAVGFVSFCRSSERRWLCVSYAVACAIYAVAIVTEGPLKHWLSGFWYTDPVRLAANAAVFAVPLAAAGLSAVVGLVRKAACRCGEGGAPGMVPVFGARGKIAIVLAAFVALNFYPSFDLAGLGRVRTAFGETQEGIGLVYSTTRANVLTSEERDFVEEANSAMPDGAVVINEPNDGSVYAYALDGMSTVYRRMRDYGGSGETEGSKLVRARLDEISKDADVRDAVREMGAEYVLQLDNPAYSEYPLGMQEDPVDPGRQPRKNPDVPTRDLSVPLNPGDPDTVYNPISYVPDEWEGIDSVNDSTPGFEVVLAEGDMRLYRIVAE